VEKLIFWQFLANISPKIKINHQEKSTSCKL